MSDQSDEAPQLCGVLGCSHVSDCCNLLWVWLDTFGGYFMAEEYDLILKEAAFLEFEHEAYFS